MKRWIGVGAALLALSVQAQGRFDSSGGGPAVVEKPAPSRFYGTAPPPGSAPVRPPMPPAAPGVPPPRFDGAGARVPPPVAPPVVVVPGARPTGPVYVPPPGYVRPPPPPYYVHPRPPPPHVDIVIGGPVYRPWPRPYHPGWGWGPPAVVVPPTVVVPAAPPPVVYVERPAPIEDAAPVAGFWYWCAEPEGWYPEVVSCPQGWLPVPPRADR